MSVKLNPLSEAQTKALGQLLESAEPQQLIWLSGYFQGLTAGAYSPISADSPLITQSNQIIQPSGINLTILYGSHTGRSEGLAKKFKNQLAGKSISAEVYPMDDYSTKQLEQEQNLLVIVSTHGEGEPPEMAEDFHKFITGKRAPKLPNLKYSVLALGDKSYKYFCQTGIEVDQALKKSGASELTPIVSCDVDFEADANRWFENVLMELEKFQPEGATSKEETIVKSEQPVYSKKNPFSATVLDKVKITGRDSDKEVYHFELLIEGSGITYEPGDTLGVIAQNPPQLVENIIDTLGVIDTEVVETEIGKLPFNEALAHHYEITLLTRDVIQKYANATGDDQVKAILDNDEKLDEYLFGHDVLDLLHEFPYKLTATDFLELLRPLPPRLYSISSSQDAVGDEVHITVSRVRYETKGRERYGACSSFLADRLGIDDQVLIYIDKNQNFRLPDDASRPIIMVGAGTGIAPYRAFLQQRESANIKGKSWLFFGERRFSSDFLYQVEWQKYLKKGYLEKIDLAFSRDQEEKFYVQHRLAERQEEIFEWLENGANFYLCGDLKYMARDVQSTLLEIIKAQGGMTEEKAKEYFKKLKKEKRFQADVY